MNTDHKLKTDVLAELAWELSSADHIGVTATFSDDIQHALQRSWFFDEDNIHVSAEGGKVHLTGTVDSWVDRQTAASTAWAAPGTTSVENDVRARPSRRQNHTGRSRTNPHRMNSLGRKDRLFAACLAALAGYVDALAFLKLGGFFVSFMSGNSTRLGVGYPNPKPVARGCTRRRS